MSSNSPGRPGPTSAGFAGLGGSAVGAGSDMPELRRPQLARELVEHGVDHARLAAAEEAPRNADIFVDRDLGRHVGAADQLERAGAQAGAQHRIDALDTP